MIEISEEKYWKKMGYYDGLLYCQLLEIDGKNDWRMLMNRKELYFKQRKKKANLKIPQMIWVMQDKLEAGDIKYDNFLNVSSLWVVPVRNIW